MQKRNITLKNGKKKIVWILDEVRTAKGDLMIYYRELDSYPYDTKSMVIYKK